MTGAELKTLRESMGLSVAWLAEKLPNQRNGRLGVTRRRLELWEAQNAPVPESVATIVNALQIDWLALVHDMAAKAKALTPGEAITLRRFHEDADLWRDQPGLADGQWPVKSHAMMLARVKEKLKKAEIHYDGERE